MGFVENGESAYVYATGGNSLSLDLLRLAGREVTAAWFGPSSGALTDAGGYGRDLGAVFRAPGTPDADGDWILVLDAVR